MCTDLSVMARQSDSRQWSDCYFFFQIDPSLGENARLPKAFFSSLFFR